MCATEAIRNFGIIAHIDAGKTTLTERILLETGAVRISGAVDEGTTVSDYLLQERERGISIVSSALTCHWREWQFNLIDTPGHIDFTAEVERSLRVMDSVIAVFCGLRGVQAQSEMVWRRARRYGLPALTFVNKLDREGADFDAVVAQMSKLLGDTRPLVLTRPLPNGKGVLDVLSGSLLPGSCETPSAEFAQAARAELVEQLAEVDEELLRHFVNDEAIPEARLLDAIRRQTLRLAVVPVFAGSAATGLGVPRLLDAIGEFLPNPAERLASGVGKRFFPVSRERLRMESGRDCLAATVVKVVRAEWPGDYAVVRLYSGKLFPGQRLRDMNRPLTGEVGAVWRLNAAEVSELPEAASGEIVGFSLADGAPLPSFCAGDTLIEEGGPELRLARMHFPEPVVSEVFAPATGADRERLAAALAALVEEDPTLRVRKGPLEGQFTVSGLGELHLQIVQERLRSEHRILVRTGQPQVAYRATVAQAVRLKGEFIRQLSPTVTIQAAVELALEPLPPGTGIQVDFPCRESADLPADCLQAIEQAVDEVVTAGSPSGYPMTDTRITVLEGSTTQAEPSEPAFLTAARNTLGDALAQAREVVLEPVMRIEVSVPQEQVGAVMSDLTARRGRIELLDSLAMGSARVVAMVPLAEVLNYASSLRSLTGGRAEFTAEPACYQPR
ncbi:MAG: GTP-binding protein [Victivallales bacterium]|nr:GTP-binding protein [Victivallales bacterium]